MSPYDQPDISRATFQPHRDHQRICNTLKKLSPHVTPLSLIAHTQTIGYSFT